jgi:hypothetical protein
MTPRARSGAWVVALLLVCACGGKGGGEAGRPHGSLFVTREGLEPDKLASIWLIKRFVDSDARFEFVQKGDLIDQGTPFDTPDAELRRYHDRSCYQSVLRRYGVDDPALVRIGEITYDIEINFWADKRFPESREVATGVNHILNEHPDDSEACIDEALVLFDGLLERIRTELN